MFLRVIWENQPGVLNMVKRKSNVRTALGSTFNIFELFKGLIVKYLLLSSNHWWNNNLFKTIFNLEA